MGLEINRAPQCLQGKGNCLEECPLLRKAKRVADAGVRVDSHTANEIVVSYVDLNPGDKGLLLRGLLTNCSKNESGVIDFAQRKKRQDTA